MWPFIVVGDHHTACQQGDTRHADGKVGNRAGAELVAVVHFAAKGQVAHCAAVGGNAQFAVDCTGVGRFVADRDAIDLDQDTAAGAGRRIIDQGDGLAGAEGECVGNCVRRGGQVVEFDCQDPFKTCPGAVGAADAQAVDRLGLKIEHRVGLECIPLDAESGVVIAAAAFDQGIGVTVTSVGIDRTQRAYGGAGRLILVNAPIAQVDRGGGVIGVGDVDG